MRNPIILLVIVAALVLTGAAIGFAASVRIEEANLSPSSIAEEVNRGANGDLYVSDSGLRAVWQVSASGVYTLYPLDLDSEVMDAQPDGHGDIWFAGATVVFGRIRPGDSAVDLWTLAGAENLGGLAIDDLGRVWLSQEYGSSVFRFDPETTEVCTYTTDVAPPAPSTYVAYRDGMVWLANWGNDRLYRLDPELQQLTYWRIIYPPLDLRPHGLAPDADGNLWWADWELGALARLDPAQKRVTVFDLPMGSRPMMIEIDEEGVWYTEDLSGTVGVLYPDEATGRSYAVSTVTKGVGAACDLLGAASPYPIAPTTDNLGWTPGWLDPTLEGGGWTVYALPSGSSPYGIAAGSGSLWVADRGRRSLVRLTPPRPALDLEKLVNGQDADEAPGPALQVGEPIAWTYLVTNTGNVDLTAIVVTDDNGTPLDPADDYVCSVGGLAAGAADLTTCQQAGAAAVGPYQNVAVSTGLYEGLEVSDADLGHYVGAAAKRLLWLPLVLRE